MNGKQLLEQYNSQAPSLETWVTLEQMIDIELNIHRDLASSMEERWHEAAADSMYRGNTIRELQEKVKYKDKQLDRQEAAMFRMKDENSDLKKKANKYKTKLKSKKYKSGEPA